MECKSFLPFKNERNAHELYNLKVLVPTSVIGPIIGKKGAVVTNLENTYHVKVAVSPFKEIYPGSHDRVCLLSGEVIENILFVNDYIMEKVSEIPDTGRSLCYDYDRKIYFERSKQVKFLIPQISAAKIIGLHGKTIKWMKSTSGSFIQISQSSRKVRLYERCIIVAGDLFSNKKACRMIFSIIAEDTKATFYKKISYSNMDYPIPSAYPIGPPLAGRKINDNVGPCKDTNQLYNVSGYVNNGTETSKFQEFLNAIQMTMSANSYNDATIERAKNAFHFLIRHGILNVCAPAIIKFLNHDSSLNEFGDGNTRVSSPGNEFVGSGVKPIMNVNTSVPFSDRFFMGGNTSTASNDIPIMGIKNASVSSNARSELIGNSSMFFNDKSTTEIGNTPVSLNNTSAMGGNTSVFLSDRPKMSENESASVNVMPTIDGRRFGFVNDRPTMSVKPSVSESSATSFFTNTRSQDAAPLRYMSSWNRFSSPLVSINNCPYPHFSIPNYPAGSSELLGEDSHYPTVAGRNSVTNIMFEKNEDYVEKYV